MFSPNSIITKQIRVDRIILILNNVTAGEVMSKKEVKERIKPKKRAGSTTGGLTSNYPPEIPEAGRKTFSCFLQPSSYHY